MINKKELCKFLVKAKKSTYASGDDSKQIKEDDGSTTLIFEEGSFKYHDNYFGGEPYGGREVVFYEGSPVYIMTYYGLVDSSISDVSKVYECLQSALSLIPEDYPFRGPSEHKDNNFTYRNGWSGEIDDFAGEEEILLDGKQVYKAKYLGGFVDQR